MTKLTKEQSLILELMQYCIDEDKDDSELERPDKCRACGKEWWFSASGKQLHKVLCPVVIGYKIVYGEVPKNYYFMLEFGRV